MDKKINVLYDATILTNGTVNAPARSGVYFVAYNILQELLTRKEFDITLYCEKSRAHLVLDAINSDDTLKNLPVAEYSKLDNLIVHWELLKYKNKVNKGNKILRVLIKTTLNFLKSISDIKTKLNMGNDYNKLYKNYDAFFSPVFANPPELNNVKHLKKYNILYDVIPIIYPENYPDMKDKSSWYCKLFNSLNKDDHYFAISEHTKQDFVKFSQNVTAEQITTIPLSTGLKYERVSDKSQIDKVKEKYKIPQDKKYLFSLCTLEPRKNLIFGVLNFIEFIKRNNIDDFVFVLGGGHWDHFIKELNDSIEDLDSYKDKIIKIGYVDDEDMPALYSGADMFVFPSVYEGFGMPILEAMQCGCPTICSKVTSMPEVIGDCGIQIDPTDNEDLIKAYEKMYFDGNFKEQCIEKGYERAKQFTWEKCVDVIAKEILENE